MQRTAASALPTAARRPPGTARPPGAATDAQAAAVDAVDQQLNPLVASLAPSKTMALTDLARSMRESGIDVSVTVTGMRVYVVYLSVPAASV
jgi:hypothetical protein